MSQQSDMADKIYLSLEGGPVPVADLVVELRERWGTEHGAGEVHAFVDEVAACLLWRGDVDIGDFVEGAFNSWGLEPDYSHQKLEHMLDQQEDYFSDRTLCVFKKGREVTRGSKTAD
jgi:hypothetical protein